jgi:hypothetical protein
MAGKPRTILVTFAGRRDRMSLLTRYVDAAIQRGVIDEWHVWDFTRNSDDARWLRQRFPAAQATPNNSVEYFRAPRPFSLDGAQATLRLSVRATNDVHVGLRRRTGSGPSYEVVLGGWSNRVSAIRTFDDPNLLVDVASRDPLHQPVVVRGAPGLLPEFDFSSVELEIGEAGLKAFVGGNLTLAHQPPVEAGEFDVFYRTGHGSNGDWRLPGFEDCPERLFVVGPEAYQPKDAMFYNRAYQYYVANREAYQNDVILKCDDDIVYFDINELERFVSFRRKHEEFFLVSANVVNNGVCAHFQQSAGAIPPDRGYFELPPGGMCGSLWSEGAKAESLHALFLSDPSRFRAKADEYIVWNERISINFIAMLGRDLVVVPDVMQDDEHELCYGVRKRARKINCIYPGFLAAHLSFWRQDADMNLRSMLEGYASLAATELASAGQAKPSAAAAAEIEPEPDGPRAELLRA